MYYNFQYGFHLLHDWTPNELNSNPTKHMTVVNALTTFLSEIAVHLNLEKEVKQKRRL